jgi:hypothetical protein
MRSKLLKKRLNIARKTYDLEVRLSLGEVDGTKLSEHNTAKHLKLRRRYEKFYQNPVYLNRLWGYLD